MGVERRDNVPVDKQRGGEPVMHVRQWLMLPNGVDTDVWTREAIWEAAQRAETRSDAREGRYFDITWPRELPTDLIERCVEELYRPLVDLGLIVQVDWETSPAEGAEPNDHLHVNRPGTLTPYRRPMLTPS